MVDQAMFNIPRPASFVEPESDEAARRRRLKELVWDRVPNRLREHPLRDEFRPLVESFEWGVSWVLLGPTGSGKSSACVHLIRELLRRGVANGAKDFEAAKSIFWTRADAVTAAGGEKTDEASKLLHRAEYSNLMILDDLAEASKTLLRVVQKRYDAGKPLIVTSGALDGRDLREMVGGDAVVRWLLECGRKRKGVILCAQSMRQENGELRAFPRRVREQPVPTTPRAFVGTTK